MHVYHSDTCSRPLLSLTPHLPVHRHNMKLSMQDELRPDSYHVPWRRNEIRPFRGNRLGVPMESVPDVFQHGMFALCLLRLEEAACTEVFLGSVSYVLIMSVWEICTCACAAPSQLMFDTCAVKGQFKFAFGWDMWSVGGHVLMAGRDPAVKQASFKKLPCQGRIINYQLLREDIIGGNVGGVQILVKDPEQGGVHNFVLYCKLYQDIRDEASTAALRGVTMKCDTVRSAMLPGVQVALIRKARLVFDDSNAERLLQNRQIFGRIRLEASVHNPCFLDARGAMRTFLQSLDCVDMMEEDERARSAALLAFLRKFHLQVIWVCVYRAVVCVSD